LRLEHLERLVLSIAEMLTDMAPPPLSHDLEEVDDDMPAPAPAPPPATHTVRRIAETLAGMAPPPSSHDLDEEDDDVWAPAPPPEPLDSTEGLLREEVAQLRADVRALTAEQCSATEALRSAEEQGRAVVAWQAEDRQAAAVAAHAAAAEQDNWRKKLTEALREELLATMDARLSAKNEVPEVAQLRADIRALTAEQCSVTAALRSAEEERRAVVARQAEDRQAAAVAAQAAAAEEENWRRKLTEALREELLASMDARLSAKNEVPEALLPNQYDVQVIESLVAKGEHVEQRVQELERYVQKTARDAEEPTHRLEEPLSQLATGVLRMAQLLGVVTEDVCQTLAWRDACSSLPCLVDHAWLRSRLPKRASVLKILRQKADAEQIRELHEKFDAALTLSGCKPDGCGSPTPNREVGRPHGHIVVATATPAAAAVGPVAAAPGATSTAVAPAGGVGEATSAMAAAAAPLPRAPAAPCALPTLRAVAAECRIAGPRYGAGNVMLVATEAVASGQRPTSWQPLSACQLPENDSPPLDDWNEVSRSIEEMSRVAAALAMKESPPGTTPGGGHPRCWGASPATDDPEVRAPREVPTGRADPRPRDAWAAAGDGGVSRDATAAAATARIGNDYSCGGPARRGGPPLLGRVT